MAAPTDSADILAAEQTKKEEKSKAREERKKAEAQKRKKEAEEEAIKLRYAQLKLANSIRYKDHRNNRPLRSQAKLVSSKISEQSHQAQKSVGKPFKVTSNRIPRPQVPIQEMASVSNVDQPADVASLSSSSSSENLSFFAKPDNMMDQAADVASVSSSSSSENVSFFGNPDRTPALVGIKVTSNQILMEQVQVQDMAPVSNVDQPADVASVSSSATSENISFLIGEVPISIPPPSVETKTNDEEMKNNAEAVTVPGTSTALENISFYIGHVPIRIPSSLVETKTNDEDMKNNAEAVNVTGTTIVTATLSVEKINILINADLEINQFANAIDMRERLVDSEAKNSNDAEEHKFEARKNELVEESKNEEENIEARTVEKSATITGTDDQIESEKRDAEAKGVEEAASTSEEESRKSEIDGQIVSEKEHDAEAKGVEEAAGKSEEEPDESSFDDRSSWEEEQVVLEDIRVEEAATAAGKKSQKRKKNKKSKQQAGRLNGSYLSVHSVWVLSFTLVCILIKMVYRSVM